MQPPFLSCVTFNSIRSNQAKVTVSSFSRGNAVPIFAVPAA